MLPDNARRAGEGAPQQSSEIVGGSDSRILADARDTFQSIERDCDEREYRLRLQSAPAMAAHLGIADEALIRDAERGEVPCIRGNDQRLLFDPVQVEIRLREQSRSMGEWGDSECVLPPRTGVAP